jgi:outer membrane protein assembly factor BamB
MKKLAALALTIIATVSVALADTRVYTRPTVPTADALKRLNLQLGWRTYLPVDGGRDGVATLQVFGPQVLVQLRSGVVIALDAESGQTMWRQRVGNPYRVAHALTHNYNSIIGYDQGTVYALDRGTGQVLWTSELPAVPNAAPVADSERVYVCTTGNRLLTFKLPQPKDDQPATNLLAKKKEEQEAKEEKETKDTAPKQPSFGDVREARGYATAAEMRSGKGSVLALGPLATGTQAMQALTAGRGLPLAWEFMAPSRLEYAPALTRRINDEKPGFLILGSSDGTVYVSLKNDRALQYRIHVDRPLAAPVLEYGGVAFITTDDNYVLALNIEAGTTAWRFGAGGPIVGQPEVTDEDVYVSSQRGGVYRLRRTTGDLIWRNASAERFLAASKKWVYARSASGQLLIIDRARGTTQAVLDLRDFTVSAANDYTDRVFLAANDGLLICLRDRDISRPEWNKKPIEELPEQGGKKPATLEPRKREGEEKKDGGEEKKDGGEMKKDGGEMKKDGGEMKKDEEKKDEKKDDKDVKKDDK